MTVDATAGLLIVDDDALVRSWLRFCLAGSEFRIVGEASTVEAALELVDRRRPELLVIDYHLRDGLGTSLLGQLREAGCTAPALLITASPETGLNEAARALGAQGTALKSDAENLLRTLRLIHAGGVSFDPNHPRRPSGHATLSKREREVLALMAGGSTNREIARTLEITDETVKTLVGRIYAKLGVHKRAEAVSEGYLQGLFGAE